MQRNEFIGLHGEDAWKKLVEPKQSSEHEAVRNNANIIAHSEIVSVMKLLGIKGDSLIEARKQIK